MLLSIFILSKKSQSYCNVVRNCKTILSIVSVLSMHLDFAVWWNLSQKQNGKRNEENKTNQPSNQPQAFLLIKLDCTHAFCISGTFLYWRFKQKWGENMVAYSCEPPDHNCFSSLISSWLKESWLSLENLKQTLAWFYPFHLLIFSV